MEINMQILEQLNWRYATKVFDPTKTVSEEDLNILASSLVLTPSSFGLQPWKFIIIGDQKIKEELFEYSWKQKQVLDCSHHIVFCYKENFSEEDIDTFLKSISDQREVSMESLDTYGQMMKGFLKSKTKEEKQLWMKNQTYIALGNFLTVCAQMKIDACPMEGIIQSEYDRILGLNKLGYKTSLACPIGYRDLSDAHIIKNKVRYKRDEIVEFR